MSDQGAQQPTEAERALGLLASTPILVYRCSRVHGRDLLRAVAGDARTVLGLGDLAPPEPGDRIALDVHPADRRRLRGGRRALVGAGVSSSDYRIRTPTGEWRWLHDQLGPDPDDGELVGVLTPSSLAGTESGIRFYDRAPVGFHMLDADGVFTHMNRTELDWLGYTRPEVVDRLTLHDLLAPTSREVFERTFPELKRLGAVANVEAELVRRDGSLLPVAVTASAVFDEAGSFLLSRSMVMDVSQQNLLRARQREHEAALDHTDDLIARYDRDLRCRYANPAYLRTIGLTEAEVVGRQLDEILESTGRAPPSADWRQRVERAFATGQNEEFVASYPPDANDARSFHVKAIVEAEEPGAAPTLLVVSRDITTPVRAQRAAEQANHAKSTFLSRMSHELRTPLNAILGFAQLLQLEPLPPDQADSVDQILRGGRHLLQLVNEVLDLSRIEAGAVPVSLEPVDPNQLVVEVATLLGPLAAEREVSLQLIDGPGPFVLADRQRLKQVLLNLVANAIKYNHAGGHVWIDVFAADNGQVAISVTDTGPGVEAGDIARLFEPFERLGAERTGEEGTGLGLALSRRLAELMNGTLEAESIPGAGSVFTVRLPCAAHLPPPAPTTPDDPPGDGPTVTTEHVVLLVEDNLTNVHLIERILAYRPNVRLETALQGRIGLEIARAARPDLVLLDLHLPDMSGEEVLARLRRGRATAAVPVVVVSADATPATVERVLAAGALAFLPKPIEVARLLALIDETLADAS